MFKNSKTLVALLAAGAITALTGCGQAAPGATSQFILKERQHTARQAAPVAKVNRTESVIDIVAPAEHKGTGAIAMNFKFPEQKGYSVLATAADIAKITVTLKTRSFLLTKTVATVDITQAQIVANKAAVRFTGLEAKGYTVDIQAFNAANASIGTTTESVDVTAGQTATVNSKLQLVGGTTPPVGGTGLDVNLEIVNGN